MSDKIIIQKGAIYTKTEACKALCIRPSFMNMLRKEGRLKSIMLNGKVLFTGEQLIQFINENVSSTIRKYTNG
ncbi:hypothetical protein [Parafilimonas sp.]|uniref:hypothetical protein n=1 Tax=Parafilimonas sp. TaxID=1969739 RepID=UPI0039E69D99